jgi:hypothetical protein
MFVANLSNVSRGNRDAVAPYAVLVDVDTEARPLEAVRMAFGGRGR